MLSAAPPGGSVNACAQLPAGEGTGASARPFADALQPSAGSASISVPPAAGTGAPDTPTWPDATGTIVPSGSRTLTLAGGVISFQIAYLGVVL